MNKRIDTFAIEPGTVLAGKYEVVGQLGVGWEGEVYEIRERGTAIIRAAKFFFPQRNPGNRKVRFYARKLHKLRHCPILIQYHTQETIEYGGQRLTFLVSEYVEGELLSRYLARQPGGRLSVFEAVHLLHNLAAGVEQIHHAREYHGDLHTDNILVRRRGISFDVKLIDMFYSGAPSAEHIRDDVRQLIVIFHELLGGARHYQRFPRPVKSICCGLRRSLIAQKFRTAGQLREYLETIEWSEENM